MNATTPNQTQSQNQEQTVAISVEASGDPVLEQRIFQHVQSVGRQLGYLSAVVRVLLDVHEGDAKVMSSPGAGKAIADFKHAQADIECAKRLREPERILEQLRLDKGKDPSRAPALRAELRAWLDRWDAPAR
jgi:hypothetical protein